MNSKTTLNISAVALRLRDLRGDVSQKAFGKKLGVTQSYINHLENGRQKPSLDFFVNLAMKNNLTLDFLILGVSSSKVSPNLSKQLKSLKGNLDETISKIEEIIKILN